MSRTTEIPVDMCHGVYPGAACCNTAQRSCDTPSVYAPASPHAVHCSVKRSPSQPTSQRHVSTSASKKYRRGPDLRSAMTGLLTVPCTNKGKERKSIYIASIILYIVSKRSDMDHRLLLTNCTTFAFPL